MNSRNPFIKGVELGCVYITRIHYLFKISNFKCIQELNVLNGSSDEITNYDSKIHASFLVKYIKYVKC